MKHDDWISSDTMRAISKILPLDDPNNPINLARAAAAEEARKAAEAAASQPVAPPAPNPALAANLQKLAQIEKLAEAIAPSRKKRRKRRRIVARVPKNETSLERHQRLCTICDHEDREDIEADFLNWLPAGNIAHHYDLDYRAVYRHARATGLFAEREQNLRGALSLIVEHASTANITGGTVLRAIRAYSCLDRTGHWTDPPVHVVVSSGSQLAAPKPAAKSRTKTIEVLPPSQNPPERGSDE